MDFFKWSLDLHEKYEWKIETSIKPTVSTKDDLSLIYSPWVAEPCREIARDEDLAYKYTLKGNTVLIVSDGSAVLGLWNIWAKASLPVMEWKAALFKEFGDVNGFPIVLDTQDTEEIIKTVKMIAPTVWGINLEDISAPRCFEIEDRLKAELDIPVFHDDQHGTAIVTLAWIINGIKITNRDKKDVKVVVNGLGAAGTAIIKLLKLYWIEDIVVCDSKGLISSHRDDLNSAKKEILEITNKDDISGNLKDAIKWRDVFVGVSVWNLLNKEDIKTMNNDSMIFAMANPTPEIMPEEAKAGWALICATWRSDLPNQLNNVLVFPWIFKWALKNRVNKITDEMKINAAMALAGYVENPTPDNIIPSPLDKNVADIIAESIK